MEVKSLELEMVDSSVLLVQTMELQDKYLQVVVQVVHRLGVRLHLIKLQKEIQKQK